MHMQAPAVTPLEHPDIIRISFQARCTSAKWFCITPEP
jgi:hypothetical protein